jgi:hypothetical protein
LPTAYKEESVKIPVAIAVLLVILISVPMVLWILKINDEGTRSADVTSYETLIRKVNQDVRTVRAYMSNDAAELESIRNSQKNMVVTLIVPEVVIIDEKKEQTIQPLKADLDGIYWSPSNPLVSINDETYRIGDIIQGYEIIKIDKTVVHFQASDGTIVLKDMYGDLLKGSKR